MSYVAVVVVKKDNTIEVHVDSSIETSFITMEALADKPTTKNVFRKVISTELFVNYSYGGDLIAEINYDRAGIPKIFVEKKA
jgi:hypothetical protein